jgi:hypothetical protein
MKLTTFDYARALKAITPAHSDDVDGKQMVASMDLNYSPPPSSCRVASGRRLTI